MKTPYTLLAAVLACLLAGCSETPEPAQSNRTDSIADSEYSATAMYKPGETIVIDRENRWAKHWPPMLYTSDEVWKAFYDRTKKKEKADTLVPDFTADGRVTIVEVGTKVQIVETFVSYCRVKVLDGPQAGREGPMDLIFLDFERRRPKAISEELAEWTRPTSTKP